jgi:hypothetical protein
MRRLLGMKVYHRTNEVDAIRRDGFKDGSGTYLTANEHSGVWVSDCPLDVNEGAGGNQVLELTIPGSTFERYEWVEDTKNFREALVPAASLNHHLRTLRVLTEDEINEVISAWLRLP